MPLYFITGNKDKFKEVKAVLPNVKQLDVDLPEIQSVDAEEIIRAKILVAFEICGDFNKGLTPPLPPSLTKKEGHCECGRFVKIGMEDRKTLRGELKNKGLIGDYGFIVEDTSLYLDALNGLPGPFIKWFLEKMGTDGIFRLCEKMENYKAEVKTIIGYGKTQDDISFFEGVLKGIIVKPKGDNGFGFDSIFMPDGFKKTLAEMSLEEKNKISMRRVAVEKLRNIRLINTDEKRINTEH